MTNDKVLLEWMEQSVVSVGNVILRSTLCLSILIP